VRKPAGRRSGIKKASSSKARRPSAESSRGRSSRKRAAVRSPVPKRTAGKRAAKSSSKRAGTKKSSRTPAKRPAATRKRASGRSPGMLAPIATTVRGAVAGAVAAVADKMPWPKSSGETDAIQLLETDHRRMEDLLKKGEETTTRGVKTRTELLNTLTRELNAHEHIEETVLYPALRSHPEAKDIVLEGYEEHHVADLIVKELHGLARDDEQWGPKFKVLKENIEHHIEEEEDDMFPKARGIFSREELQQLGALMADRKKVFLDA
jgi:hemerythrin-like domain-containing protein